MLVVIRGAGDIASGIALRLYRAGIRLVLTDLPNPTAVRRTVCFSEAIRLGEVQVEDVAGRLAHNSQEALELTKQGIVPVLADPEGACIAALKPDAVVDAILAKKNLGTHMDMAPAVIAVGPGETELAVQDLLYDPQTSGGLMMAVHPEDAPALLEELRQDNRVPAPQLVGRVVPYQGDKRIYLY